jgi:hypothetical protein
MYQLRHSVEKLADLIKYILKVLAQHYINFNVTCNQHYYSSDKI